MNNFGNGIPLSTGFDLNAPLPLDSKSVVDTIEELLNLSSNNLVCHGQTTYVEENAMYYQYTGQGELDGWTEFCSFDKVKTIIDETKGKLENDITTLEEGLSSKIVLSMNGLRTEFSDMASGFLPSIKEDMNGIRSELTDINNNLSSQISQTSRELNVKMLDLDANLKSEISITAGQLRSEFSDMAGGDFSSIIQDVDSIRTQVSAMDGRMSELEQTADGISIRVTDVESDLRGEITATASQLRSEFSEISGGDFSSIIQEVDKIKTDVADMEEELTSSITQTASSIRSEVADFKNEVVSSIEQTASEIRSEVSNLDGKYTSLKQTVDEFKIEAGDGDALNAKIEATASEIRSEVSAVDNKVTQVQQTANKINWLVKSGTSSSNMQMTDEAINLIASKVQIEAGEIKLEGYTTINGGFKIDNSGNMTAKNGKFEGSITGSSITGGSINIGNGVFKIDSDGKLTATSADIKGKITATSGKFTGEISGSTISGGSINIGNGTFKVGTDGKLTATSADIKGKITATSGSFKGDITGGSINIGNGTFKVDSNGNLTATKANISGTVNANSGTFKGTIETDKIMKAYGAVYAGTELWGGFTLDSNGEFNSLETFKVHATNGLLLQGSPLYLNNPTGEVRVGDSSAYKSLRAKEIYAQEIIYSDTYRARTGTTMYTQNLKIEPENGSIEFGNGNGIVRVTNAKPLYLQTNASSNDDTATEIKCTMYKNASSYIPLRAYNLIAQNAIYAKGTNLSSDRTLKENINYISNANIINENEGITITDCYNFIKDDLALATYNYINDEDNKLKLGFIAQDVLYNVNDQSDNKIGQLIVQDLLGNPIADSEKNTLSYDVNNILGVIMATLQVATQKIEQLEARIIELENK